MKRSALFFVFAIAASATLGVVHANDAQGRIAFVGKVVNESCDSSLPPLGIQEGIGSCHTGGSVQAVYVEHTGVAAGDSGIAMLDYFAGRSDGGRKMVVTRQYR